MTDLINAIDVATTAMTNQIAATSDDQLSAQTPCTEWDAKALIEHTQGTCNFLTGVAGGSPVDADLWEGDASAAFSKSATAALTAWRDRGVEGTVDLGGHEMPASMVAAILALDVYLHTWDLATATGAPLDMDEDICGTLLEMTAPAMDGRRPDGFAATVDVADDAPASQRLIAYSGRSR